MVATDEREVHIYNGADPTDDTRAHVRLYGELTGKINDCWVVDSYNPQVTDLMVGKGLQPEKGSGDEGVTFVMTAKQLIEFIAAEAGLHIEFRKRKPRTITEEQRNKYRAALAEARKNIAK